MTAATNLLESQTTPSTVIEVNNLGLAFNGNVVLKQVSFSVKRGEILFILGGSGCGKSTLLKAMIRLYRPNSGSVEYSGENIVTAEGDDYRRLLRRFGVMYQGGALFGSMTLRENLLLVLDEFTDLPQEAKELLCRIKLQLVGLEPFLHHYPSEISGGMKKRAAIARAMVLDPEILFLDEPSAGLDPVTSAELDRLIRGLSRGLGITFVIVSHELASIFDIADRVVMLDRSVRGVVAVGTPQDLRDNSPNEIVRRFFNREVAAER